MTTPTDAQRAAWKASQDLEIASLMTRSAAAVLEALGNGDHLLAYTTAVGTDIKLREIQRCPPPWAAPAPVHVIITAQEALGAPYQKSFEGIGAWCDGDRVVLDRGDDGPLVLVEWREIERAELPAPRGAVTVDWLPQAGEDISNEGGEHMGYPPGLGPDGETP